MFKVKVKNTLIETVSDYNPEQHKTIVKYLVAQLLKYGDVSEISYVYRDFTFAGGLTTVTIWEE